MKALLGCRTIPSVHMIHLKRITFWIRDLYEKLNANFTSRCVIKNIFYGLQ